MPGNINYIIPTDSMTLSKQEEMRRGAVVAGISRAVSKLGAAPSDVDRVKQGLPPESVDVREFQPILDAGAALDQWNTAALAVVGTAYTVFQAIAAPTLAANKIAVFYKVGVETIPPPVSRLIFRKGGAAGNIVGIFDLEHLFTQERLEGYFSQPQVFDPTDIFALQVLARIATGVLARVPMGAWIIERAGQVVA